ncbi:porin [Ramlibacter sp. PS3R-8]|uniref:porin n=1 Tax=Ramlibacter sp. PS3R-8 TaxID=3133437 RepID=UPI003099C752
MKKTLIALAVMAAAGAASAQSSVTLFGIVDATAQWTRGSSGIPGVAGDGDIRFRVTNSGYNSSRLGFRGTEDLGGGMAASFWLEAALSNDDGNAGGFNFQRRSTVSLSGGWGELRVGRDYTPTFWNLTVFDPFGTNGSGTTALLQSPNPDGSTFGTVTGGTGPNTVRASNSIGYFLPANIGGVYGQFMYAENELRNDVGTTIDNGRYFGGRIGFASGPFNIAASYGRTDVQGLTSPIFPTRPSDDITVMNLGGSWDFGVAKLMGQLAWDKNYSGFDGADAFGFLIGGLVPVGAGEIRLAYSQYSVDAGVLVPGGPSFEPKVKKLAIGYVHNLSKRTAVYSTIAKLKNSGGAFQGVNSAAGLQANDSSVGLDLGIRHSF